MGRLQGKVKSNDIIFSYLFQFRRCNFWNTKIYPLRFNFWKEVQIFRAYVLWEEELGFTRNKPFTLCFVSRFNKNEFISSDAMSKLRQVSFGITDVHVWKCNVHCIKSGTYILLYMSLIILCWFVLKIVEISWQDIQIPNHN